MKHSTWTASLEACKLRTLLPRPYLADAVILLDVANEEVRAVHLFELSHIGEPSSLEDMRLESVLLLHTGNVAHSPSTSHVLTKHMREAYTLWALQLQIHYGVTNMSA